MTQMNPDLTGSGCGHITDIGRLVSTRKLLEISEVEQELVSGADQSTMLKQVSMRQERQ